MQFSRYPGPVPGQMAVLEAAEQVQQYPSRPASSQKLFHKSFRLTLPEPERRAALVSLLRVRSIPVQSGHKKEPVPEGTGPSTQHNARCVSRILFTPRG